MRKAPCVLLSVFLSLVVFLPSYVFSAQDASFSWLPNTESNLAGYKIYYGKASNQYDQWVDVGNPVPVNGVVLGEVTGLADATTYYFAAIAYDAEGVESDFSPEVVWTSPAAPEPPVATDLSFIVAEDNALTGQLEGMSADGLPLVYQLVSAGGKSSVIIVDPEAGTFLYQPITNVTGFDAFTYTVQDANGISEEATVSISITPVNDMPIASNEHFDVQEDTVVSTVLAGSDIDSSTLVYEIVSNGRLGTAVITDSATGSFTYTPNPDSFGEDLFQFRVHDGFSYSNVADVEVTVHPVNDLPVAFSLHLDVEQDSAVAAVLTGSDKDSSSLTYEIVNNGLLGSAVVADPATGSITYTPNSGAYGEDLFQFRIHDGFGYSAAAEVTVTIEQVIPVLTIESGDVAVDETWTTVFLSEMFRDPVVVARTVSFNDENPCVVRIRNVTPTGFEVRLQNYQYLNLEHSMETVHYIVMERGSFELDGGVRVEAGVFHTDVKGYSEGVPFIGSFIINPVVVTSIVTNEGNDPVVGRVGNVSLTGFDYEMQEEEAKAAEHVIEAVSYIAWEPSVGMIGEFGYEVRLSEEMLTHDWHVVPLNGGFIEAPVFITNMQSENGTDTASLSTDGLTATEVQLKVTEEQSYDTETNHVPESFGFIALSWIDADGDPDDDGLSNSAERDIYGTDPTNADTDADGLTDGVEVDYWDIGWLDDSDNDGIVNLLDPDSDNDSFLDGEEVDLGYDPVDINSNPDNEMHAGMVLEYGTVEVGSTWKRVSFTEPFENPVVVAKLTSQNDSSACVVRMRYVDSSGFNLRIQEWNYLDDNHSVESVSFIVMEQGSYVLPDGTHVEAGVFSSNDLSKFSQVVFTGEFAVAPVVTTSVITYNGGDTVTGRIKDVSSSGMGYVMQEQELYSPFHVEEKVAYIAWEPSAGMLNGLRFDVRQTPEMIDHEFAVAPFSSPFADVPVVVSDMQSALGMNTATVRTKIVSAISIELNVEEEQSKDSETSHCPESVGYMAFGS